MPTLFDDWTLEDARRALASMAPEDLEENRRFYEGDHWQDGEGWIGPHVSANEPSSTKIMEEIERAFISRNVVREVVRRHAEAVIGLQPAWRLTPIRPMEDDAAPNAEEQTLIDEAEALLTTWWDARNVLDTLQEVAYNLLWSKRTAGRMYIPSGRLPPAQPDSDAAPDNEVPTARVANPTDLAAALELLYFDAPKPDTCGIYEDPDTKSECGIFWYRRSVSVSELTGKKLRVPRELEYAELTYLDDNGNTVLRTIGKQEDQRFLKNFGKRLNVFQVERENFVTEQVRAGQRALNLALTMVPRNVITGGFLERSMINAQAPGEMVKDPLDPSGQREYFRIDEMRIGAGTTAWVSGIKQVAADGSENLTTPSVQYREPIDVAPSVNAKKSHYEDILGEVDQTHILIQGEATVSGVSREQARADFERSLRSTVTAIENIGRWVVETALAMAEQLARKPGAFTKTLRATFECRVDLGPLSTEELQQNRESVKEGLMAAETAMSRNGIVDVDAELAKIAARPQSQLDLLDKQATILSTLSLVGIDIVSAAKLIGMTDAQIAILQAAKDEAEKKAEEEFKKIAALQGSGEDGDTKPPGAGNGKKKPPTVPAAAAGA